VIREKVYHLPVIIGRDATLTPITYFRAAAHRQNASSDEASLVRRQKDGRISSQVDALEIHVHHLISTIWRRCCGPHRFWRTAEGRMNGGVDAVSLADIALDYQVLGFQFPGGVLARDAQKPTLSVGRPFAIVAKYHIQT
jgi:hypothetical protein